VPARAVVDEHVSRALSGEEAAGVLAGDHAADDLGHLADMGVALPIAEDVAAGGAVPAEAVGARAAVRAALARQAVTVDVVADALRVAQLRAAVVGALPPAAHEGVGRARVRTAGDRAAELGPPVAAERARAAVAAGDDRLGAPRPEQIAQRRDGERRAADGDAHEDAAPR